MAAMVGNRLVQLANVVQVVDARETGAWSALQRLHGWDPDEEIADEEADDREAAA